jgi:hypothetical protein
LTICQRTNGSRHERISPIKQLTGSCECAAVS